MKKVILFMFFLSLFTGVAAENKDTAVVQAPDGSKYEVKVPREAISEVKKTGPNTYDVKVNRQEMRKMEVKPLQK